MSTEKEMAPICNWEDQLQVLGDKCGSIQSCCFGQNLPLGRRPVSVMLRVTVSERKDPEYHCSSFRDQEQGNSQ